MKIVVSNPAALPLMLQQYSLCGPQAPQKWFFHKAAATLRPPFV